MNKKEIINKTACYVKENLSIFDPGHDWWHIQRVWNLSRFIGTSEKADLFIVELSSLLHDIADYKFHNSNEEIGPQKAREWLSSNNVPESIVDQVVGIIRNMNYKGAIGRETAISLEHSVVQDADRLDALGAIGIARAFSFGGYFKREIYNPSIKPNLTMDANEYRRNQSTTINHFYEKLLFLKEKMLTETGKRIAEERDHFMRGYLEEFLAEWNLAMKENDH